MTERTYAPGQAYNYPLIIKKLLQTAMVNATDQEIVYRDQQRYSYRDLFNRIHRLAGGLTSLGLKPGEVAAVFDYDSPRYLECFFAIPMMGSTLQTVNWRLSTEQIVYTINHAEASVIIFNSDFLPLVTAIRPMLTTVRKYVLIREGESQADASSFDGEYEGLLQAAAERFDFPDLDENYPGHVPSTPPAPPATRRGFTSPTASWCCTRCRWRSPPAATTIRGVSVPTMSICRSRRCSMSMPGVCPMSRQCSPPSRSTPADTSRRRSSS